MKHQFNPESGAQVVDVQNGDYKRRFVRAEQPFDVTEAEARLLRGVDDLEPVPAALPEDEEVEKDERHDEAQSDAAQS